MDKFFIFSIFREFFAVNVYELTWIKFGGEVYRNGLVSNHLKRYVTLYTLLQYENQSYFKNKQKITK